MIDERNPSNPDGVKVVVSRQGYTEFGTLGRLRAFAFGNMLEPAFTCLTAEDPWRDNRRGESCIPEGDDYVLVRSRFNRGGYDCFEILRSGRLPIAGGRTLVKIHKGNSSDDVEGCIVLGNQPMATQRAPVKWGVGPSGGPAGAFTRFMKFMDERDVEECPLVIKFEKG